MNLNLTMGARNGAKNIREENDFYATYPEAVELFVNRIEQDFELPNKLWEPACGQGHMSEVFKKHGYNVYSTDLVDRGYKYCSSIGDFLDQQYTPCESRSIITNPPFKYATKFAYNALDRVQNGQYVAFFVKLQFLESAERRKLFDTHTPRFVYVYTNRQQCSMNADFENLKAKTQAYCWVIWQKGFNGECTLRWI